MIRVYGFVEGQTEQTFCNILLYEYFFCRQIIFLPILVRTSKIGKGGLENYEKVKKQIINKWKEEPAAYFTTMFDFFRLPKNFPGKASLPLTQDPLIMVRYLEEKMNEDMGMRNFSANFTLHEFEGLLFSEPMKFSEKFGEKIARRLEDIRKKFSSPEHINGGDETAPSKRIDKLCPGYRKKAHGPLIAKAIGLEVILEHCPHFKAWVNRISNLGKMDFSQPDLTDIEKIELV